MKDLIQRSSFRGRNLLDSVTRALSPSRTRSKSPSFDQKAKVSAFRRSVKKSVAEIDISKKSNPESAAKTTIVGSNTNGRSGPEPAVANKDQAKGDKRHKSVRLLSSSSSGSANSDSSRALSSRTRSSEQTLSDVRSSSGASSQGSGGSTPTKSSVIIEYVHDGEDKIRGQESLRENDDTDSIYESRKLLFRKMIELEVKEFKTDTTDAISVADSWDDLEENFAKIYEPIPLKTDIVRNMTKKDLLRNISNPALRSEVSKMSDDEIFFNLNYIPPEEEYGRVRPNCVTFAQNELPPDSGFAPSSELEVMAEVHRSQSDTSDSEMTLKESDGSPFGETDYETRTELYRNIRNLRNSLARRQQQKKRDDDVDSWKSVGTDEEPVYVSRSEILSRHDLTPQPESIYSPSVSSLSKRKPKNFISRSEILSRLDKLQEVEEMRAASPGDMSLSSQDSWSIKDHEMLYERKVVSLLPTKKMKKKSVTSIDKAVDFEADQSCSELEEEEEDFEDPDDVGVELHDSGGVDDGGGKRRKRRMAGAAELQRRVMAILATQQHIAPATKSKVMDIINQHIQDNSDSLDYAQFELRNEEIRNKLKEALAHDWETLSNINLGLIYVPMEENLSIHSKKSGASRDMSDYDTFGSLDSLIFEPKVPSDAAITEASEEMSSISSCSQLSVSLSVLPGPSNNTSEEFKGMNKVKSLVTSFDDIYSGKCITYDPKNNETSITSFKVGSMVKKLQKRCSVASHEKINNVSDSSKDQLKTCPSPGTKDPVVSNFETGSINNDTSSNYTHERSKSDSSLSVSVESKVVKCCEVNNNRRGDGCHRKALEDDGDPHCQVPLGEPAVNTAPRLPDPLAVSSLQQAPDSSALEQTTAPTPEPPPLPKKPSKLRASQSYSEASDGSQGKESKGSRLDRASDQSSGSVSSSSEKFPSPEPPPTSVPLSSPQKVPLKKKFFNGLAGLGFRRFSSKESVRSDDVVVMNESENGSDTNNKMTKSNKIDEVQKNSDSKELTVDIDVQFDELCNYSTAEDIISNGVGDDTEVDHYEPAPNSITATSLDSESESITSVESVIYKGSALRKQADNSEFGGKKMVNRRDKYVVNHGHESDTSEFDKSASVSTALNIDSDTSWDYVHATGNDDHAAHVPHPEYTSAGGSISESSSELYGPRVIGNLRRKKSPQLLEKTIPTPIETFFNDLRCQENLMNGDHSEDNEESMSSQHHRQMLPSEWKDDLDHKYNGKDETNSSVGTSSNSSAPPPVMLLKHHVYQSVESLISQRAPLSSQLNPNENSSECGELQLYGSRNGEPIYGARNSLVFQSMNGAYVTREPPSNPTEPPVIIRNGKVVELTEEMFKSAERGGKTRNKTHSEDPSTSFGETSIPDDKNKSSSDNISSGTPHYENQIEFQNCTEEKENTFESKGKAEQSQNSLPHEMEGLSADFTDQVTTLDDNRTNSSEKIKRVQKLGVSIMGDKNNDLMIRELKLKLRRKFIADDSEEDGNDASFEPFSLQSDGLSVSCHSAATGDGKSSVASKREQLAPHMSKIFGSLYQKRRQSLRNQEELLETNNPVPEEEDEKNNETVSEDEAAKAVVTHHEEDAKTNDNALLASPLKKKVRESIEIRGDGGVMEQLWLPTPDYTPLSTLPRHKDGKKLSSNESEFSLDVNELAKLMHDPGASGSGVPTPDYDCTPTPCPECDCESYASEPPPTQISKPAAASDNPSSPKRSVRFDMSRHLDNISATWSDIESVIFTEDRSFGSVFVEGSKRVLAAAAAVASDPRGRRMDSYQDGLLWEQLALMRRSKVPEQRERWQTEKTKRMLLWIHLSTNSDKAQWCYRSHWWKAKQRASVMWIVQKANKNKVPAEYQDPYYRDHEGREHLKPGIVAQLANADLYCSALANIYGDPNFFSLSHWKVIQALARKGVYVAEPTDVALNETVLLQDSPIKMSAHLAVIEAMMALYIREVVVAERVVAALQKMSGSSHASPHDQEEALVFWVAKVTAALQERIATQVTDENQQLPEFPRIQDLSDLSDGIGLAALVSYYCPQELAWGDIAVADPPSMADSLYNIGLVIKFCHESLPYNPCLLTKEDIVYMHSCVKQNVLAFVTELFFLLELQPVSCVAANTRRPSSKYASPSGMKPAGAPSVRRSHSMTLNDMATEGGGGVGTGTGRARVLDTRPHDQIGSSHSDYGGRESSMSDGPDGEFVVQRARGVSTLSDMIRSNKEAEARQGGGGGADHNHDTHDAGSWYDARQRRIDDDTRSKVSQEDDDSAIRMYRRDSQYGSINDLQQTEKLPPAGMPSRFENRPQGRSRSRRNSISAEESQLTVENFGGSQDNLNEYISRNTDKEAVAHVGRKDSSERNHSRNSHPQTQIDNRVLDKLEREAIEREKREFMFGSKNAIFAEDPPSYDPPPPPPHQDSGSDSDRSSDREKLSKATSFAELSKIKEQLPSGGINIIYMQGDKDERKSSSKSNDKKTSFAALPNQTTWKQQITQGQSDDNKGVGDENMEPQIMASELHNVRLKLEEKRRNIEAEKRKMELMLSKQRQKMGKEAFMQAVVKGDIGAEVSQVSRRWLEGVDHPSGAEVRTPDMDNMDYDQYQHSLTQMTDSLSEIQGDIQRLSSQQVQIQGLIRNGAPQQPQQPQQFYLHDQSPSSGGRRMWGDGGPTAPGDQFTSMSPATRRAQWGPVRPVPGQGGDYYQQGGGYYPQQPGYQQLPPLHQQPPPQGGGFMLHQAPYSLPAGAQQPGGNPMYQQQNGGQYYGAAQDHHYRGGYPPPPGHPQHHHHQQQYPPPAQDGGRGGPAPFRLHTDGEDSSRGPSSLRSSAQSSPSRQPLQQHPYGHPYPPHYSPHYSPHPQQHQQGYNNHLQHGQMNQQQNYHTSNNNLNGQQSTPGSRQSVSPSRGSKSEVGPTVIHAPVAAPPPDDMEPQNVSFIDADSQRASQERETTSPSPQQQRTSLSSSRSRAGGGGGVTSNSTSHLNNSGTGVGGDESPNTERLKRMSIGSGSRTYRITNDGTSPTRPTVGTKTFRVPTKRGIPLHDDADLPQPLPHQRSLSPPYRPERDDPVTSNDDELLTDVKTEPLNDGAKPDKGFYITFDDDPPVKPKPQLRTKKFTRKSSTPTTPVSTPSKEDYPIVPDVPLRNSRFPSNASLDLTPAYRRPSPFSPLSPTSPPAPYPGSSLRSPLSPNPRSLSSSSPRANGFSYAREEGGCLGDSTGESGGEELPLAEVAGESSTGLALLIGDELLNQEESALTDMERKKQKLMIMSMRRKQQQEEIRTAKELEAEQKREKEKEEEDRKLRKKEEEKQRREIILERHKIKKAIEEAEKEGRYYQPPAWYVMDQAAAAASQQQSKASVRLRNKPSAGGPRPRPKTMIEGDVPDGERVLGGARRTRGSTQNIAGPPDSSIRKSTGRWGSSHSLSRAAGSRGSTNSLSGDYASSSRTLDRRQTGRRPTSIAVGGPVTAGGPLLRHQSTKSLYGSRSRLHEPAVETPNDYQVHAAARRPSMADNMTGSLLRRPSGYNSSGTVPTRGPGGANRRYRSTGNLSGGLRKRSASEHDSLVYGMSEDSGLGRATPPRRAPSPGMAGGARHLPSPSQPGSLPPGLITRRRPTLGGGFDDAASDISATSSTMDFTGPRLYKQPASKSNRPIVLNAVEFCVFPGAVNQHNKQRVMEEIARSEAKHFLFLFRDTGCQFRGLYSYNVESEEVDKLHGTGPKRVTDNMFDKFFKYNSGAKSFSQVHTKHLTATIDAFTIHNSLWQGKRVSLPSKKDYALVI